MEQCRAFRERLQRASLQGLHALFAWQPGPWGCACARVEVFMSTVPVTQSLCTCVFVCGWVALAAITVLHSIAGALLPSPSSRPPLTTAYSITCGQTTTLHVQADDWQGGGVPLPPSPP